MALGKTGLPTVGLIILKQLQTIPCFKALGSHQQGLGGNSLLNRLLAKWFFSFLCVAFPEVLQTGHRWIWGEEKGKIIFLGSDSLP